MKWRDFLKKIGSNFRIADRTLVLDFIPAFKIAKKYHAEALCAEAVSYDFTKSENWRRDRDSNPGSLLRATTVFETVPFDHSGISPKTQHNPNTNLPCILAFA